MEYKKQFFPNIIYGLSESFLQVLSIHLLFRHTLMSLVLCDVLLD